MKGHAGLLIGVVAGIGLGIGAMWILGGSGEPEAPPVRPSDAPDPRVPARDAVPGDRAAPATDRASLIRSLRRAQSGEGPGRDDLLRLLETEQDPQVRSLTYAALAATGDRSLVGELLALFRSEEDHRMRYAALEAAAILGGPEVDAVLQEVLETPLTSRTDLLFRDLAAEALVSRGDPATLAYLADFIRAGTQDAGDDPLRDGRDFVLHEMGVKGGEEHARTLASLASDPEVDEELRADAVRSLASIRDGKATEEIRALLDAAAAEGGEFGRRGDIRLELVQALASRPNDPEAEATLREVTTGALDLPPPVRVTATRALGGIPSEKNAETLLAVARDTSAPGRVRDAAWVAYGQAGGAGAVETLVNEALNGESQGSRLAAVKGLDYAPPEVRREALERVLAGTRDPKVRRRVAAQLE